MLPKIKVIDSPERMIDAIRAFGIVPFFRNSIPGWSIEEHTAPGYWFGDAEDGGGLGPWDWKIDCVREGDIAYGKFLNGKAAFATVEWYRHLMNWRRSLPQYRLALGEMSGDNAVRGGFLADGAASGIPADSSASGGSPVGAASATVAKAGKATGSGTRHGSTSSGEKADKPESGKNQLTALLSPTLLTAIKENGSLESAEMRRILKEKTDPATLRTNTGCMSKYLVPEIKKQAVDHLLQYLEMGTWTVIGDFTRVYRGPNLTYSGWQRSSITTPDALFAQAEADAAPQPFWAKFIDDSPTLSIKVSETPSESREILVQHLLGIFPDEEKTINKVI